MIFFQWANTNFFFQKRIIILLHVNENEHSVHLMYQSIVYFCTMDGFFRILEKDFIRTNMNMIVRLCFRVVQSKWPEVFPFFWYCLERVGLRETIYFSVWTNNLFFFVHCGIKGLHLFHSYLNLFKCKFFEVKSNGIIYQWYCFRKPLVSAGHLLYQPTSK